MSNILVQMLDEKIYQVIGEKFLRKTDKCTFKYKNTRKSLECKVVAYNDDRNMLKNIAKLLNQQLPIVNIYNELDESVGSQLLSRSYVNNSQTGYSSSHIVPNEPLGKTQNTQNESFDIMSFPICYGESNSQLLDYIDGDENNVVLEYEGTSHDDVVVGKEDFTNANVTKLTFAEMKNTLSPEIQNRTVLSNSLDSNNSSEQEENRKAQAQMHQPMVEVDEEKPSSDESWSASDSSASEYSDSNEESNQAEKIEYQRQRTKQSNVKEIIDKENKEKDMINNFNFHKDSDKALGATIESNGPCQLSTSSQSNVKSISLPNKKKVVIKEHEKKRQKNSNKSLALEPSETVQNSDTESVTSSIGHSKRKKTFTKKKGAIIPTKLNESQDSENDSVVKANAATRSSQHQKHIYIVDTEKLTIDESGNINISDLNRNVGGTPRTDPKLKVVSRRGLTSERESKVHICMYCGEKIVDKIKRHLLTAHRDEKLIRQIKSYESNVQSKILIILVNLGDYYANTTETSEKELFGARRLNQKQIIKGKKDENTGECVFSQKFDTTNATFVLKDTSNGIIPILHNFELPAEQAGDLYVYCVTCLKCLKKSYLRKHKCPITDKVVNVRGILKECENLIPDIYPGASTRLRELVIKKMQTGPIKEIVKKDKFIILYGNDLVDFYNKDQNYSMISHQLRVLADFVKTAGAKDNKIKHLSDIVASRDNATLICDSIKEMAEHDEKNGLVKKGNKIPELTTLLNKVIKFIRSYFIETNKDDKEIELKALKRILKNKFRNLNKKSRDSLVEQAKEKPILKLPSSDDINKLYRYAEGIRVTSFETLQKGFDANAFKNLNEATLLLIQLFNRKRQGEISRLLKSDIREALMYRLDHTCTGEEYNSLSERAKQVAKEYVRISILNKKGLRIAGLIIHQRLLNSINLIMEHRSENLKNNKYVFATDSVDKSIDHHFEAYRIMRRYAERCGVEDSTTLRGTMLRKQIATMVYAADIQDNNLKDLANFLGHELKIHLNYYRQQIPVREIINLTPLLEKAQGTDGGTEENHTEEPYDSMNNSHYSDYEDNKPTKPKENNFFYKEKLQRLETKIAKKTQVSKRKRDGSDDKGVDCKRPRQGTKTAWTLEERNAVKSYITKHGIGNRISKEYIKGMQEEYAILKNREILIIRAYIHNYGYTKEKSDNNVDKDD